ncbi:hypothetical protein DM01DRAFT_315193 [Hesseltinella vesiculosa]|uniref:Uncharacterized protein n=1 Tax=Hesseltinella vesiculosa TaxID=101127 RepID=A0A1X2GDS4_9FUNG|nr:hypothetical protein DM01DRAFT_315193 [Hesseltinella vesiculosa]
MTRPIYQGLLDIFMESNRRYEERQAREAAVAPNAQAQAADAPNGPVPAALVAPASAAPWSSSSNRRHEERQAQQDQLLASPVCSVGGFTGVTAGAAGPSAGASGIPIHHRRQGFNPLAAPTAPASAVPDGPVYRFLIVS